MLYNLPSQVRNLPEGIDVAQLPTGTLQGTKIGVARVTAVHDRYFHKIFTLNTQLLGLKNPGAAALVSAMRGHILARAELIGVYQRQR